jgi:hypothetical protein
MKYENKASYPSMSELARLMRVGAAEAAVARTAVLMIEAFIVIEM